MPLGRNLIQKEERNARSDATVATSAAIVYRGADGREGRSYLLVFLFTL